MRKSLFVIAAVAFAMLFYSLGVAVANSPIKIFVDGKEIKSDVPAQLVNGRTMIPLRVVGEALGAEVSWDAANKAVIITSVGGSQTVTPTAPIATINKGLSKSTPVPMGTSVSTPDGFTVSVSSFIDGDEAWDIIRATNLFDDVPAVGHRYVMVGVTVASKKSVQEPEYIRSEEFALVGSSNVVFSTNLVIRGQVYNGGTMTVLCFHIPKSETSLVLSWDKPWDAIDKIYFDVK